MPRLVLDDPRHLGAAVEIHPPGHDGIDRARHVPHVVSSDLARRVGQPVRELRRLRIEQEPWGLDRITGNADDTRLGRTPSTSSVVVRLRLLVHWALHLQTSHRGLRPSRVRYNLLPCLWWE